MKNVLKKALSILLATVMVFGSAPLSGFIGLDFPLIGELFGVKAEAESNTCGNNLIWNFDEPTGILTVSGTGDMTDWSEPSETPWDSIKDSIREIKIEDGVTSVGSYAFYGCENVNDISIPESIIKINDYAFSDCFGINRIILPSNLESVSSNAFDGCVNLQSIELAEGYTESRVCRIITPIIKYTTIDGVLYVSKYSGDNGIGSGTYTNHLVKYPAGRTEKEYRVESYSDNLSTTLIIDDYAFKDAKNLEKIVLPDNLCNVNAAAFDGCINLKSIELSEGYSGATSYGNSYVSIDGVLYLSERIDNQYGGDSYYNYLVKYPAGKTETEYAVEAYSGNENTKIIIDEFAFKDAKNLEKIVLPSNLESLSSNAFDGCINLQSIELAEGYAGASAYGYNFVSVDGVLYTSERTSEFVTNSYRDAYYNYLVKYPAGRIETEYAVEAYSGNSNSKIIISEYAFKDAKNLEKIILPSNLESLSSNAFDGCINLQSIELAEGYIGATTYGYNYISIDGILYTSKCARESTTTSYRDVYYNYLVKYPAGRTETEYAVEAYSGNSNSKIIICEYAFKDAKNLEKIVLPSNLESLSSNAFDGCINLQSIELAEGYTGAATYGHNYISIDGVLYTRECARVPSGSNYRDVYTNYLIKYPAGKTETEYVVEPFSDYYVVISEYAFKDAINLEKIILPATLEYVSSNSFDGCINLCSIELAEGYTEKAFTYSGYTDRYKYASIDGVLFLSKRIGQNGSDHYYNYLVKYPAGRSETGYAVEPYYDYNFNRLIINSFALSNEYTNGCRVVFDGTESQWNNITLGEGNDHLNGNVVFTKNELDKGDGTAENPYQITDKYELDLVRNNLDAHYILMNDIEFTEADFATGGDFEGGFVPIGTKDNPFSGSFDGNGNAIIRIEYSIIDYSADFPDKKLCGLFGANSGEIKNINLEGLEIEQKFTSEGTTHLDKDDIYWGSVIGCNFGLIDNCSVSGDISVVMTGYYFTLCVGGIVGYNDSGEINNCKNSATLNVNSLSDNTSFYSRSLVLGGIVGSSHAGIITLCSNHGNISGYSGYSDIGGICGDSTDFVSLCYNVGKITGRASKDTGYLGGIIGWGKTVENCYNYGMISKNFSYYEKFYYGGIAGYAEKITDCYNAKYITLDDYSKGICGITSCVLTDTYYLWDSNTANDGKTTGCIDEKLQMKDTYIGFDFDNIWYITDKGDYPYPQLRANPYTELVPSTSVSFESDSVELEIGKKATLNVTVEPADTTDSITYASSDENVVTVDENGEITAVGVGTATVTATTSSGLSASCTVTVAHDTYQITWNVDGVATVQKVKAGDPIVPPEGLVSDGFIFVGWSPEVPEVMPENDLEFFAYLQRKTFTISFEFVNKSSGASAVPTDLNFVEDEMALYGDSYILPAVALSGYSFDYWYDENNVKYPANYEYLIAGDTTLYCYWTVSNSTVSFYGYEALAESPYKSADPSVVLGSANYDFGETIVFPAESSFPANAQIDGDYYTFVGWAKTAGGTVLTDAELYTQTMPAEDTAYYAVYERVKVMLIPNDDAQYWADTNTNCTTVIDRAGGTVDDYNEDDSAWYVYGLKEKITVNPTIDYSRLSTYVDVSGDGYYEVVEFKVKEGSVGTGTVINVYDNITDELVESFQIIIYGDVNGDGAIINADCQLVLAEAEGTTNKSDKSSDDYNPCFVKAADMNGNGIIDYFDAAVFKNFVFGYLDIDQTTGKWFDRNEYALFFYTDETLKVSHGVKFYSGDKTIVLPEAPTKDGYNFVGWFDYETNEPLGLKMPEKTVFAYAVWEESLEHTVTYYVDGEVYETYSALFGDEVTIPADPVKVGYTFSGWTPEVPATMPESDIEFTAIWTANKYKVKWNIDGMTMSQSIAYGSEIPVPDDPEKDGFEFAGWSPAIPETMPAEDITFTAMWNAKGYIITWVVDGVETQTAVPYGEAITVPETPAKEGHTFEKWVPEIPETMPANDLTFTANFNVNSYYVTWIVDGSASVSYVKYGDPIVPPAPPVKDGFRFVGWTPTIPSSMPGYDMAFVAVWETDYSIDFSFESADIEIGDSVQLEIVVTPEPSTPLEITWSSSDESVATVDENGLVTAVSCGSAVITAEADGKTAFVTVNVAHKYISATTEPTCTQNGFTTHTCSVCGDVYMDNLIEATGHSYNETVVESSCTGTGYTKYECTVCGHNYTDNETPAAGHKYDAIVIKPTCTTGGYTINMCSVCGYAFKSDEIGASGHNYSEKVVEATCISGGYTEHTCLNCGDSYKDNIVESGEHNYVASKVVEPNCTVNGYTEYTCSYCSDTYTGDEVEATGHKFTSVTNSATCTNSGYTLSTCDVCGFAKIENQTEALGHEYIEEVVPATCESGGYTRHTCVRGDHVYISDETPSVGHNYEATEIKTTCIQNGCVLNICLTCGRVNKSGATQAYGHSFNGWVTVTEAGENTEGLQTRTCKNCGYTEEKIIPMLQRTTYTATFVVDGNIVSCVEFLKDATEITEPEVPQKNRYSGKWEEYTLTNSDITINAEYTLIDLDTLSGIDFGKNASYNSATGEATISLYAESEAEKIISQTSKKVPLDIVLVVDQSGSMAEKLGGRVSKQDALIASANDFVNSVYADASANGVDHRIAVVGFGMGNKANGYEYPVYLNTEILTTGGNPVNMKNAKASDYASALMSVNAGGRINADIVNAINSIDAKGATAADFGLSMANNVFANNADAEGRQRIVVFMTDGEPTYASGYDVNVANAAVQQAHQLKNTYGAYVYSVGIFDENKVDDDLVKFMNHVSSNCKTARSAPGNFDMDSDKFYVTVANTDALSDVFTEIVIENVTMTTDFDNITLIDTVSEYFTLTSQQEKALRISAIEKFGVKNSDITVTRNANGTTAIEIRAIHPEEIGDKFVVSLDFTVSANENASVAGNYATNTEDAGIIVGDAENYECVFNAPSVNIPADRNTVVFNVNGEVYAIKSVAQGGRITAPETDFIGDYKFTGWNIPAGTVAIQPVTEFDATLVNQECVVIWNTDNGTETVTYAPGDVITVPDVAPDKTGMAFRRWNGEVPVTMPAKSIEFTAVYGDHEHKYVTEVIKAVTCLEDGETKYICSICDGSYIETVKCAGEHSWKAITGPADKNGHTPETFKCEACGVSDNKTLEYMLLTDEDGNVQQEFNYVDENGNHCQPNGELTISVPLDGYENAEGINVYRLNDDGTKTQCDSRYEDGILEFDTDHFSTYIFEPIYQCIVQGNHPDSDADGKCDVCRKWLGITVTWIVDGKKTKILAKTGEKLTQPDAPVKEGYTFIGWTPEVPETVPKNDVTFTAVFEAKTYTVKWIVDGNEITETYEFGSVINVPVEPEKDGYFFAGWTPEVPATMPAKDMTFTAKFADYDVGKIRVTIAAPESRTVQYKDSITLYANVTNLPEGATIRWSSDNNCVTLKSSNGGKTCTVTSKSGGTAVVTAYIVDANGEAITTANGVRVSGSIEIVSDVTFTAFVAYFFRTILTANPFLKFVFRDFFD